MKPLYPYKTLFGDLRLTIGDLRVDGDAPPGDRVSASTRSVDLAKLEKDDWLRASFDVSVSAPTDEVASHEADGPVSVCVVVHCVATNARFAFVLARSPHETATWTRTLELPRNAFSGPARIRCVLTGAAGGRPSRWLGEAVEWTVHFDEPVVPEFDGAMPVEWISFDEALIPEQFRKEAFYPSFDPVKPRLYLNKDFDGLPALLRDRKRTGAELALHESTRSGIATDVWGGLFNASLASVIEGDGDRDEDEEVSWPDVAWQENVLRSLLNDMYAVKTPDEGLKELREAWRSHGGGQIQAQLLGAIQTHVGTRNLLARSIKAINLARTEGD